MAAATDKPSPSNRPIDETTIEANSKVDDAGAAGVPNATISSQPEGTVASPEAPAVDGPPTYLSVEASETYQAAKRHLSDGNFEEALTVIEEGIRDTKALLQKFAAASGNEGDDFELHEAIAPLHYLYGTTLLYSIEESDQEVTTAGSAVSTAVVSGGEPSAAAAASMPGEGDSPEEDENQPVTATDVAEDIEIAWENLEAARNIIVRMEMTEKLELDLAQIYLREGDLQLMNGRNENAIKDYHSCLRLRQKSKFVDKFDRKIADVHYNLGLVYMNLASKDDEADQTETESEEKQPAKTVESEAVKEAKKTLARNKGVFHFLEASKCLCGSIANTCQADADALLDNLLEGVDIDAKEMPNFKTTGEEDTEMELPKIAGAKLQTLRKRAAVLVLASTELTLEQKAKVDDLLELLDEIQETVDESENATKGVQEVTNMKDAVSAMAAADGEIGEAKNTDAAEGDVATGTTTIGFGSASAGVAVAAAAAPAAAADARPMMVVKKKKKRAAVEPVETEDSKKAKAE